MKNSKESKGTLENYVTFAEKKNIGIGNLKDKIFYNTGIRMFGNINNWKILNNGLD